MRCNGLAALAAELGRWAANAHTSSELHVE